MDVGTMIQNGKGQQATLWFKFLVSRKNCATSAAPKTVDSRLEVWKELCAELPKARSRIKQT